MADMYGRGSPVRQPYSHSPRPRTPNDSPFKSEVAALRLRHEQLSIQNDEREQRAELNYAREQIVRALWDYHDGTVDKIEKAHTPVPHMIPATDDHSYHSHQYKGASYHSSAAHPADHSPNVGLREGFQAAPPEPAAPPPSRPFSNVDISSRYRDSPVQRYRMHYAAPPAPAPRQAEVPPRAQHERPPRPDVAQRLNLTDELGTMPTPQVPARPADPPASDVEDTLNRLLLTANRNGGLFDVKDVMAVIRGCCETSNSALALKPYIEGGELPNGAGRQLLEQIDSILSVDNALLLEVGCRYRNAIVEAKRPFDSKCSFRAWCIHALPFSVKRLWTHLNGQPTDPPPIHILVWSRCGTSSLALADTPPADAGSPSLPKEDGDGKPPAAAPAVPAPGKTSILDKVMAGSDEDAALNQRRVNPLTFKEVAEICSAPSTALEVKYKHRLATEECVQIFSKSKTKAQGERPLSCAIELLDLQSGPAPRFRPVSLFKTAGSAYPTALSAAQKWYNLGVIFDLDAPDEHGKLLDDDVNAQAAYGKGDDGLGIGLLQRMEEFSDVRRTVASLPHPKVCISVVFTLLLVALALVNVVVFNPPRLQVQTAAAEERLSGCLAPFYNDPYVFYQYLALGTTPTTIDPTAFEVCRPMLSQMTLLNRTTSGTDITLTFDDRRTAATIWQPAVGSELLTFPRALYFTSRMFARTQSGKESHSDIIATEVLLDWSVGPQFVGPLQQSVYKNSLSLRFRHRFIPILDRADEPWVGFAYGSWVLIVLLVVACLGALMAVIHMFDEITFYCRRRGTRSEPSAGDALGRFLVVVVEVAIVVGAAFVVVATYDVTQVGSDPNPASHAWDSDVMEQTVRTSGFIKVIMMLCVFPNFYGAKYFASRGLTLFVWGLVVLAIVCAVFAFVLSQNATVSELVLEARLDTSVTAIATNVLVYSVRSFTMGATVLHETRNFWGFFVKNYGMRRSHPLSVLLHFVAGLTQTIAILAAAVLLLWARLWPDTPESERGAVMESALGMNNLVDATVAIAAVVGIVAISVFRV